MAIDLKQVVEKLHSGQWLRLKCFTADVKLGTGGKVLDIRCRIARRQPAELQAAAMIQELENKRNPNHNYHFTRNVELPNKELRKIHPILIFSIDNQPVI